jgi:two-component system, chemotaxis family, sensor kinase CheA
VDGEDAWRLLEEDGADLLVADVEMPRMDGIALCRRIRASDRFREPAHRAGHRARLRRGPGAGAGSRRRCLHRESSFDQATLLEVVQQLIG